MPLRRVLPVVTIAVLSATQLTAQQAVSPADRFVEPFQIVGNVYYVAPEAEHSSYLITTPQGHILVNTGYERQVPTIRASIEKLGFKLTDVRIVLGSHAHVDHQEGDALVKQLTGAQVMAMEQDVPDLRKLMPGGKPHPIDRVLHDGDRIELGGVSITALLTPGHTKGCTTYAFATQDAGRTYNVMIGCGYGAAGRTLVNDPEYPNKPDDYRRTYSRAKTFKADVFLGSHGQHYGLLDKLAKRGSGGNPFIDATTLPNHVATYEKQFLDEMAKQTARPK